MGYTYPTEAIHVLAPQNGMDGQRLAAAAPRPKGCHPFKVVTLLSLRS